MSLSRHCWLVGLEKAFFPMSDVESLQGLYPRKALRESTNVSLNSAFKRRWRCKRCSKRSLSWMIYRNTTAKSDSFLRVRRLGPWADAAVERLCQRGPAQGGHTDERARLPPLTSGPGAQHATKNFSNVFLNKAGGSLLIRNALIQPSSSTYYYYL